MTDAIPTGPAIKVQGVSKAYGRSIALDDLDLSVPWGRALTIFGPNGSGKTTLIKVLATLSEPDAGTISIAGLDARRDGPYARRLIGVITHDPLLYDDLTARETSSSLPGCSAWKTQANASRLYPTNWISRPVSTSVSERSRTGGRSASPSRAPSSTTRRFS